MFAHDICFAHPIGSLGRGRSRGLSDPVLVLTVAEGPQDDLSAICASSEVQVDDEVRSGIVQAGYFVILPVQTAEENLRRSSPVAIARSYWLPRLLVAAGRDEGAV